MVAARSVDLANLALGLAKRGHAVVVGVYYSGWGVGEGQCRGPTCR